MESTVSASTVEQFEASAKAAVATVEIIERLPRALQGPIFRVTGDAGRVLFAAPQDLPPELFAEFVSDPRVVAEPTAEEWVNTPAGVTETVAGVAPTGSV